MKMFLDPSQPIATCNQADCQNCPVSESLHCHFTGRDLAKFLIPVAPVFIIAGVAIARSGAWLLVPWVAFAVAYFGAIEIRVLCSHCPHYAEPGGSLQCWANYGSPRLWRFRPGPLSGIEKSVFFGGLAIIVGYPLVLMAFTSAWLLAGLFVPAVVGFYLYMRTTMCSQCMNFACPLNQVDPARRAAFFERNPVIAQAWGAGSLDNSCAVD